MQNPKLGGQDSIRVFLKGDQDLTRSLLSPADPGSTPGADLVRLVHAKYRGRVAVRTQHQPGGRLEVWLQQLGLFLGADGNGQGGGTEALLLPDQAPAPPWHEPPDVLVLSIQPDITHTLWRHELSGRLVSTPPGWEEDWTPRQRTAFLQLFYPLGLMDADQFKARIVQLIRAIKDLGGPHILAFNCSAFDPRDQNHNYHGLGDTLSVRIQRFNRVLMQISAQEGISIIDVDRILAELGCERHVLACLSYSPEAYRYIWEEVLRVLEDIGFFERRPLIRQIGQRGS